MSEQPRGTQTAIDLRFSVIVVVGSVGANGIGMGGPFRLRALHFWHSTATPPARRPA